MDQSSGVSDQSFDVVPVVPGLPSGVSELALVPPANLLSADKVAAVRFHPAKPGYSFAQVEAFVDQVAATLRFLEARMHTDDVALHEKGDELQYLQDKVTTLQATIEVFRANGDPMTNADGSYVTQSELAEAETLRAANAQLASQLAAANAETARAWDAEAELRRYVDETLMPWLTAAQAAAAPAEAAPVDDVQVEDVQVDDVQVEDAETVEEPAAEPVEAFAEQYPVEPVEAAAAAAVPAPIDDVVEESFEEVVDDVAEVVSAEPAVFPFVFPEEDDDVAYVEEAEDIEPAAEIVVPEPQASPASIEAPVMEPVAVESSPAMPAAGGWSLSEMDAEPEVPAVGFSAVESAGPEVDSWADAPSVSRETDTPASSAPSGPTVSARLASSPEVAALGDDVNLDDLADPREFDEVAPRAAGAPLPRLLASSPEAAALEADE